MSVIPDRKDYKNVDRAAVGDFVAALSKKGYEQVSHIPPTEKSHFERFGLVKNARRVVIVFDVIGVAFIQIILIHAAFVAEQTDCLEFVLLDVACP